MSNTSTSANQSSNSQTSPPPTQTAVSPYVPSPPPLPESPLRPPVLPLAPPPPLYEPPPRASVVTSPPMNLPPTPLAEKVSEFSPPALEAEVIPSTPSEFARPEELTRLELEEIADDKLIDLVADSLAMGLNLIHQTTDPMQKQALTELLGQTTRTGQLALDGDKLVAAGVSVELAMAEIIKLIRPSQAEQTSAFTGELLKFPEEARALIYQELITLMLRGHLSSDLLGVIAKGGIRFRSVAEASSQQGGLPDLAIFQPSKTKTGVGDPHIILTEQLFAKNGGAATVSPRYALRHELAHAYLIELMSLFYNPQELDLILGAGATLESGLERSFGGTPEKLTDAEGRIFSYAIGEGQGAWNPNLVKPLETPYVAYLLDQLVNEPTNLALRSYILNELLAERMTAYLSSDGTLADFFKKRLEFSLALQYAPGIGNEYAEISQQIEGLVFEAKEKQWGRQTVAEQLRKLLPKTPMLSDFIEETIQLHKRFAKIRGEENLPMIIPSAAVGQPISPESGPIDAEDRRRKFLAWTRAGNLPTPWVNFMENRGLNPVMADKFALKEPIPARDGKKSFWSFLSDCLSLMARTFGIKQ